MEAILKSGMTPDVDAKIKDALRRRAQALEAAQVKMQRPRARASACTCTIKHFFTPPPSYPPPPVPSTYLTSPHRLLHLTSTGPSFPQGVLLLLARVEAPSGALRAGLLNAVKAVEQAAAATAADFDGVEKQLTAAQFAASSAASALSDAAADLDECMADPNLTRVDGDPTVKQTHVAHTYWPLGRINSAQDVCIFLGRADDACSACSYRALWDCQRPF